MANLRLRDMRGDVSHELLQPVEGIAAIVPLALQIKFLLPIKVPPLELRGGRLPVHLILHRLGDSTLAFLGCAATPSTGSEGLVLEQLGGVAVIVEGDNLEGEGWDVLGVLRGEDGIGILQGGGGDLVHLGWSS